MAEESQAAADSEPKVDEGATPDASQQIKSQQMPRPTYVSSAPVCSGCQHWIETHLLGKKPATFEKADAPALKPEQRNPAAFLTTGVRVRRECRNSEGNRFISNADL